jgi:ribokinase
MRVAVVGHVEYVEFLTVDHVPIAGEIVAATSRCAVPAGGGAVAAVALARWAGACTLYTALGDDELGHRAAAELRGHGVDVRAAFRRVQRRAVTLVDASRERTIVVIGERLAPEPDDALGWDDLAVTDAVYVTAGAPGAVTHARRARVMVSTSRFLRGLRGTGVVLDALVGSANDPSERYAAGELVPEPRLVVRTDGARGGSYVADGIATTYVAAPVIVTGDSYGAGDSFAAALTLALGEGMGPADAVTVAARRATEVLAWHGPYPTS